MTKLNSADLVQFVNSASKAAPTSALTIVGVLKDATATSVQFSADNFVTWLPLPTALIDEATYLGQVEAADPVKGERYPLFSIALKLPTGESERFLYDLLSQTTRALSVIRQSTKAGSCSCTKPAAPAASASPSQSSDPHIFSGCYACSTQYRCYRQCWDQNGNWYWRYDPVCC